MVAAGQLAVDLNFWEADATQRQLTLIEKTGLPTQLPENFDIEAVPETLTSDKKVKAGQVRFVLPTQIGAATVTDQVTDEAIHTVLSQMVPT